ncbi:Golgi apyrase [Smittium mucronatum]|uniref:Golgi apyrase n=1 Tax=Smittium mucronatum TaxID=133383 RepID=A0A1R0H8X5_9FUNG|nr:Golgi apyrase [Smittium mucronatum]
MLYSWEKINLISQKDTKITNLNTFPEITFGIHSNHKNNSFRISPGISEFGSKISKVGVQHLKPMIDFATNAIPANKHKSTPVYLMATAGVRLLDPQTRDALLKESCSYFKKNTNFFIGDCDHHFKTISGEEEGAFGWLSVNYLKSRFLPFLQSFTNNDNPNKDTSNVSSPGKYQKSHNTIGFLDMGGASTQIAFQLNNDIPVNNSSEITTISLRKMDGSDVSLNLFVTTFLGFGTNQARSRHESHLTKTTLESENPSSVSIIEDPCLAPGQLFPTSHNSTLLKGTGDFDLCINKTRLLLSEIDSPCTNPPCLIKPNNLHGTDISNMDFIGVSEYWFVSDDIFGLGGAWDMDKFVERAREFCKTEFNTSLKDHSHRPNTNPDRIRMQCFKASWLFSILTDGFSLFPEHSSLSQQNLDKNPKQSTKDSKKNSSFESAKSIESKEASWTLGAMLLNLMETIPPSDPVDYVPPGIYKNFNSLELNDSLKHKNLDDQPHVLGEYEVSDYLNLIKLILIVMCTLSILSLIFLVYSGKHLLLVFYLKKVGGFIFRSKIVSFFNPLSKTNRSQYSFSLGRHSLGSSSTFPPAPRFSSSPYDVEIGDWD